MGVMNCDRKGCSSLNIHEGRIQGKWLCTDCREELDYRYKIKCKGKPHVSIREAAEIVRDFFNTHRDTYTYLSLEGAFEEAVKISDPDYFS